MNGYFPLPPSTSDLSGTNTGAVEVRPHQLQPLPARDLILVDQKKTLYLQAKSNGQNTLGIPLLSNTSL